jgi:hypothetical protein
MTAIRLGSSCALFVLLISACHSTRQLTIPRTGEKLEGNPEVVSVTRRDRSVFTLYRPSMQGDSLVGYLDRPKTDNPPTSRVAIHIDEVRDLSTRQVDATKTTGLALGTGVVIAGVAALLAGLAVLAALGN